MDIQTRKIEFVQSFLKLQNEKVIAQFEKLLKKMEDKEHRNNSKPFSIQELNKRVSESEKDFENGRFTTTSELLSKY